MKTFRTIMVTFVVTVMVGMIGIGAFLFNTGIITVSERAQEHSKMVVVDGVVTEAKTWNETLGFDFDVEVDKLYYIGK